MFASKALLSFILTGLALVDASPLSRRTGKATLNIATRINPNAKGNIADRDRARVQALRTAGHLGKRSGINVDITNTVQFYASEVGVGTPPTSYDLLIDTGSSNTWVGAQSSKPYVRTSTSVDTGNIVSVSYGPSGSDGFIGEEWLDTVTLSPDLIIENQSIGAASISQGFTDLDGILGVGPVDLTIGTVSNTDTVPTVTDNLYSQGTIPEEVLGVYFIPASDSSSGTLTFGGYDDSVITSPVNYVPLTKTLDASTYWGINQAITYGGNTILDTTAGIVDTGTTLILIATDAFQRYQSTTGGTMDQATKMLTITSDQYNNLKPLSFHIGGTTYDLSPNGQIWPRSLNSYIGGTDGSIYLVVADIGYSSGSGDDFTNGYTFLERLYSVYDTTNGRVGFATTHYTDSESN